MIVFNKNKKLANNFTKAIDTKKQTPWWLQITYGIIVDIVQTAVELFAGFYLSPVAMVFFRTFSDVGSNILLDYLIGNNPFDSTNLITSLILPSFTLASKAYTASQLKKNNFVNIYRMEKYFNDEHNDKLLRQMVRDLSENSKEILPGLSESSITVATRKYEIIMNKYNFADSIEKFYSKESNILMVQNQYGLLKLEDKLNLEKVKKTNLLARKINRTIAFIDPEFAIKELVKFATKNQKTKINNWINKQTKLLKDKLGLSKLFKKIAKKSNFIPFSKSKWIAGIQLIPIAGVLNFFNVKVFFKPESTNNKKPVVLYNVSFDKKITSFLKANSHGKYYIDNICWGWDIGKVLRKTGLINNTVLVFSNLPIIHRYLSTIIAYKRNYDFLTKKIKRVSSYENVDDFFSDVGGSIGSGFVRGITTGLKIPGVNLIRATVRGISTNNSIYIQRYVVNKSRKILNKNLVKIKKINGINRANKILNLNIKK